MEAARTAKTQPTSTVSVPKNRININSEPPQKALNQSQTRQSFLNRILVSVVISKIQYAFLTQAALCLAAKQIQMYHQHAPEAEAKNVYHNISMLSFPSLCISFYGVSTSDYIVTNGIRTGESERIRKEAGTV
jgi:hypothetical protein